MRVAHVAVSRVALKRGGNRMQNMKGQTSAQVRAARPDECASCAARVLRVARVAMPRVILKRAELQRAMGLLETGSPVDR